MSRIPAPPDVRHHRQHPGRDGGHRPGVGEQQAQQRVAAARARVLVPLLLRVAAQVPEDRPARDEHVRQVRQPRHRGRRYQQRRRVPPPPYAGQRARKQHGGQQLRRDRQPEQGPAERPSAYHGAQRRHRQQHAEDVDVRVVHRLHRHRRTPGPVRDRTEPRAPTPLDQQQRPRDGERQQRPAGLQALVAHAGRGQGVDQPEPALGDGRVDGVHGRPVDPRADPRPDPHPVRTGAVGPAAREQPVVAQGAQRRIGGGVVVRGDPGGLHPPVPGVAEGVGTGQRRPGQPRRAAGHRTRQHERDHVPPRNPPQRPDGRAEQRPGGRVPPREPRGIGEVALLADRRHEDGGERGEQQQGEADPGAGAGGDTGFGAGMYTGMEAGCGAGVVHAGSLAARAAAGRAAGPGVRVS